MKYLIIVGFCCTIIFTPAFRCGRDNYLNSCPNGYVQDTIYSSVSILNNVSVYHIGDTIKLFCNVNDSIKSAGGRNFVYSRNSFYTNVQPYKVINNNGVYEVDYANIEFNPFLSIGKYTSNPYYSGYSYFFNRNQPYNTLKVSFIAGRTGLYIFKLGENNSYGNSQVNFNNDYCIGFPDVFSFSQSVQNKNYWDTLGISSISLTNAFNGQYKIANKDARNYFFAKVIL